MSSTRDDDDGLVAVVDFETGRVVRIPGVYPRQEKLMRHVDKLFHLGVGLVTTFLVGAAWHPWAGLVACAAIALAKEVYDKRHPDDHTADGWDAYATLVGAIPALPLLAWVMR